jgi:dienelactone hydrolase
MVMDGEINDLEAIVPRWRGGPAGSLFGGLLAVVCAVLWVGSALARASNRRPSQRGGVLGRAQTLFSAVVPGQHAGQEEWLEFHQFGVMLFHKVAKYHLTQYRHALTAMNDRKDQADETLAEMALVDRMRRGRYENWQKREAVRIEVTDDATKPAEAR